ncbi:ABC transporter ATP-binding protein [Candidatus Galacturonibacter soehngenii]|uniref:ABC transporter ATP-binding protein n=1 Tax=Candidatus Galacturonatibacter soehngenii TaxID=2307010 RepID=A0A7V7QNG2_9FIRM|nr:ABC transporter ATP-binding protein [Candidatus Galacturonibacter soehngenii]KAB1440489.1 ABC transporter ATP-binding protein [Candidatus Galacturonibacter soehngenii]
MNNVLLEAKSITKKYDDTRYVLKEVDLVIEGGQFIAILGHSGSGKSTMLNVLSTILKPTSGQVFYKGKDITRLSKRDIASLRRDDIGFVFQHYLMLPNLTVRENIQIGNQKENNDIDLEKLCDLLGINQLLERYPYQLSGGEQQRVCIARALIKNPAILFCDEATGALDSDNSKNIICMLHNIKKEYGTTIIFTTHNKEIAKTADRILQLEDGQIIEDYMNQQILSPEHMKWEI